MQGVDQDTVITDWLVLEQKKGNVDQSVNIRDLSSGERVEQLRNVWSPPRWGPRGPSYVWRQAELTESLLRSVRHAWGRFGVPGTVLDLAHAIQQENPEPEWQEVLSDHDELVMKVESIAQRLPELPDGKLVLKAGLRHPPMLIDGNHRATALALHLLRTETFVSIEIYVGFPKDIPFASAVNRLQVIKYRLQYD